MLLARETYLISAVICPARRNERCTRSDESRPPDWPAQPTATTPRLIGVSKRAKLTQQGLPSFWFTEPLSYSHERLALWRARESGSVVECRQRVSQASLATGGCRTCTAFDGRVSELRSPLLWTS
jgi:hypothetical protein